MKSKSNGKTSINLVKIFKGVFFAYLFAIFLFLVLAFIMYFSSISENIIPKAVIIISAVSILLGGINTTKDLESMGWLHGGLVGFIYTGILIILSFIIVPSFALSINIAIDIFISFLVGVVAGIIGVSL
ncbi:MAG: TIGR04086 family membrane protein [Tepidanaerobacteraceae bacterium]